MNRLDKTVFTTSATNCSHIGAISPVNNHPIFSKFPVSQKRMIEKSKYRSLFDIGVNVSKCPFRLFENTSEASNSFDTQKNTYAVMCDHKLKDGELIKKLRWNMIHQNGGNQLWQINNDCLITVNLAIIIIIFNVIWIYNLKSSINQ